MKKEHVHIERQVNGYWKPSRADIKIESKGTIVGYKKVLVFHRGKAPNGVKTNWIMHEYRLNHPPVTRRDENDMRVSRFYPFVLAFLLLRCNLNFL